MKLIVSVCFAIKLKKQTDKLKHSELGHTDLLESLSRGEKTIDLIVFHNAVAQRRNFGSNEIK